MSAGKTKGKQEGESKLTPKQALFVKQYIIDLNGRQAAIRAGYSEKTAQEQASRLLSHVKVQQAIQALMGDRAMRLEITADAVLQEIAKLAYANVQDLYDESGILKPINELPRHVAAAVSSVKVNLTEACAVQEVKLWDKKGSLELLCKHLGLFGDKSKDDETIPPPTRVEIVVKDARKECQPHE